MSRKTRVEDWQLVTLNECESFSKALDVMNQGGYQLVLVCQQDGRLAGMLTDSDIRRALLRGVDLEKPVNLVMNPSPLVVSPALDEVDAHQLMVLNHFFHLPIVDESGILIGLHVAEQLRTVDHYEEAFVIMAGGRGQRLMPLTSSLPKPMLPIKGKPILEHIIEKAKLEGFKKFVISVNYLANVIISHFGDGSSHGVSIEYLFENQPLGTAGALAGLAQSYRTQQIIVTNADVITTVSFSDILGQARRNNSDGVIAVRWQELQNPLGVVISEGERFIGLEEKPIVRNQVNAGIYVIGPSMLDLLEKDSYCDMPDLFLRGLANGLSLEVFPLHEHWLDIGRPEDYNSVS